MAKAWHCVGCATKAGEKKDGKKASKAAAPAVVAEQAVAVAAAAAPASTSNPSSETKGTGKVSWIKRTSGQVSLLFSIRLPGCTLHGYIRDGD